MKSIFEFDDYKQFVREYVRTLPKNGRGELTKIANQLGIHTTMVTHVLKGTADFSMEQTLKLASFLAFNDLETDYLVSLVQLSRAGDDRTRKYCAAKVDRLRSTALNLADRIGAKNELSDSDRAFYYSSWIYSYLRMLTAIERYQSVDALVRESGLPLPRVREAVSFLVSRGLCRDVDGRITYGDIATYVDAKNPLVVRHHKNWREKTQAKFEELRSEDIVFTYPVAMSGEDFDVVREKIVRLIEEFREIAGPSASEDLYCFNLEWLKVSRD